MTTGRCGLGHLAGRNAARTSPTACKNRSSPRPSSPPSSSRTLHTRGRRKSLLPRGRWCGTSYAAGSDARRPLWQTSPGCSPTAARRSLSHRQRSSRLRRSTWSASIPIAGATQRTGASQGPPRTLQQWRCRCHSRPQQRPGAKQRCRDHASAACTRGNALSPLPCRSAAPAPARSGPQARRVQAGSLQWPRPQFQSARWRRTR
mmetsp:Transcript_76639/g.212983  ORF Transcript_76639/g.212983 Transcript_76639/m.212983 type:complete len:204 (-) Transcript_76639:174-785(-)